MQFCVSPAIGALMCIFVRFYCNWLHPDGTAALHTHPLDASRWIKVRRLQFPIMHPAGLAGVDQCRGRRQRAQVIAWQMGKRCNRVAKFYMCVVSQEFWSRGFHVITRQLRAAATMVVLNAAPVVTGAADDDDTDGARVRQNIWCGPGYYSQCNWTAAESHIIMISDQMFRLSSAQCRWITEQMQCD